MSAHVHSLDAELSDIANLLALVARNKIKTALYLTPAQSEALKLISAETHIPVSVLVRLGVDEIIKKYRKHLPKRR